MLSSLRNPRQLSSAAMPSPAASEGSVPVHSCFTFFYSPGVACACVDVRGQLGGVIFSSSTFRGWGIELSFVRLGSKLFTYGAISEAPLSVFCIIVGVEQPGH